MPKEISIDQGGQFKTTELENFCKKRGIKQLFTNAYSPEENGQQERQNRYVTEKMRCMMIQSKAPPFLWGEAIMYAMEIANLTRIRPGQTRTSYQSFTQSEHIPSAMAVKPFGCTVFVTTPLPLLRDKLEPRSKPLTFVGSSMNNPNGLSYRAIDTETLRVTTFKNGIFKKKISVKCTN